MANNYNNGNQYSNGDHYNNQYSGNQNRQYNGQNRQYNGQNRQGGRVRRVNEPKDPMSIKKASLDKANKIANKLLIVSIILDVIFVLVTILIMIGLGAKFSAGSQDKSSASITRTIEQVSNIENDEKLLNNYKL